MKNVYVDRQYGDTNCPKCRVDVVEDVGRCESHFCESEEAFCSTMMDLRSQAGIDPAQIDAFFGYAIDPGACYAF